MMVQADAQAAFADAFERHRHGLHAFLVGRTSDREVAGDLLQETFLRLWRRWDEVAVLDESRQRAWLFTVARNLVVDGYRADATRRATLESLAHQTSRAEATEPDTATLAEARDDLDRLDEAIARLPEEHRVILSMRVVAGLNSREIGDALDLPPGTVRAKLHEARARLSRALEGL